MVLNWKKCHLKSASFLVVFFSYGFLQRENRAFVFGMRTDGGRVLTKTAAAHWRDRSTLTSQSNEIPGYIMEKSTIRHQKRLIVVRSSSSMQSGFLRNFTLLTYSKVVFQLFCPFTQPSPLQFVIQPMHTALVHLSQVRCNPVAMPCGSRDFGLPNHPKTGSPHWKQSTCAPPSHLQSWSVVFLSTKTISPDISLGNLL